MKLSKIFSVVAIVVMLLVSASNFVFAYNPSNVSPDYGNASSVTNIGNDIVGIIQVVGSVAAVGVLVVLGVKYMMGSTEEKAEYKKTLMPYIIGAILVFAASNIAGLVFSWASNVGK